MIIFRGFAFNWELPMVWKILLIIIDVLLFLLITIIIFRKDHREVHNLLAKTQVVDSKYEVVDEKVLCKVKKNLDIDL